MHKGYFHRMRIKLVKPIDLIEKIPPGERKQGSKRKILSLQEKFEISQRILIDLHKHKDVAKEYRVSVARIAMLMSKIKKKPNLLNELELKS